ncbi:TonB-dependent receptor domain-containing protein [Paracidobacterium acidisoli]|nr:TonB-dependent receptor [Paracidobacterium acidisoli]MBT9330096.1 carboxypeptidase regulatory-like domain-containing protein [Paracidobacterium acidisoli]
MKNDKAAAPVRNGITAPDRSMKVLHFFLCMTSVLLLILAGSSAGAQTTFGSILGTVTDPSGAAVPGTTVTLTNLGTAATQQVQSDSNGNYQFVNLMPDNYSVDFQKSGFTRLKRDSITVTVQAAVRVNAPLQVGNVSQTVNVTSQAPMVETQPGSLNQLVEGQRVQQMPLNGRNVLNLLELAPGVIPQGSVSGNPLGNQSNGSLTNNTGFGNYQIGGGMANQSAFYLDGVPLNTTYINSPALVPTQDAVQEFRVDSNAVSAEFGRFAGGVVNMATRSGTDAFHGSAYEYIRNRVLNANTYFNDLGHVPTPAFTQNQYGATIGGPIKHEKVFFFFSWEGFAFRRGNPITTTVPTQRMRNGDFGEISSQIYDPTTTCGVSGAPACPPGQTIPRQPFAGNQIPMDRLDVTAKQLMTYYGLPNLPGTINNFATNETIGGNTRQYNARIDWTASEKQRLFARYTWWSGTSNPADPFGTHYGGLASYTGNQDFVVGDTYTFNPTTIGDFRVSYVRATDGFVPEQFGDPLAPFGPNWSALASQLTIPVTPIMSISGFFGFGGTYNRSFVNDYSISGSMTKILGRHTLKFGGEVRRNDWNFEQGTSSGGSFSFDPGFTAARNSNLSSSAQGGYAFASFFLGYPATGTLAGVAPVDSLQYYGALYLQDTFAVNRRLTITPGIRWDWPEGSTEKHDRLTILQPNATDPLGAAVGLPLKGQIALVNSSAYPDRTQLAGHHKLFAPRVNAAWSPNDNLSIRAGYGLSWIPPDMINYSISPFQSPVNAATTSMVSSVGGTSSLIPSATLSNPFPQGLVPTIGHNPAELSVFEGQSVSSPIPNEPYGYAQQWNFELQQQLPDDWAFDIAYAGSKGTHLSYSTVQLNQLPDADLAQTSALDQQVTNPFYGHIASGLLSSTTVSRGQLLRPYPQFQNFQDTAGQRGGSHWSALETRIVKRFKNGGVLQGSYTWSKLISNTDTLTSWLESHGTAGVQDWNNLKGEQSLASFDVPNRAVISYVLELPFGHNKRFASNVGPVMDRVIGGWTVNGITILQSGFPLGLTTATNLTDSQGGGSRPNVNAGVQKKMNGGAVQRLNKWFNTNAFAPPPQWQFGNESRLDSTLRDDGIANYDFTVSKNIPLAERLNFEFKTEFFNLFNRQQFGDPNTQLGSSTFGIVSTTLGNPRLIQFSGRLTF